MVTQELSKENVLEKLLTGTTKTRKEILSLIEQKKQKFSGLLTDDGAAFMIAKELGVNLSGTQNTQSNNENKNTPTKTLKLSELSDGQRDLNLKVRLMHVFSPKKFEKNGKKGVLCNAIVADDAKEMRLTLWRDDVKKLFDEKIERGAILELSNVGVSSYNEQKQLSIGFGGTFSESQTSEPNFPAPQEKTVKLKELSANQNNIDVFAKINRVFAQRDFESNGRQGKVLNFEIADETKMLRAAAWNDLVDFAKELSPGDTVKIEGAYTKQGLNDVELNLGWQARIIKNPKGISIENTATDFEEKKISEITELSNAKIKAKIERIENGKLHYFVCPDCGKKLERDDNEYNCLKCGEKKEPDINLVVGFTITDGENSLRAVMFGKQAEKTISVSKEEMKKLLEEKQPEEIVEELNEKLAGKTITVQGRVRKNSTTDENELIVQSAEGIM